MVVFLAGYRSDGRMAPRAGAAALRAVIAATPFLGDAQVQTWTCPAGRVALVWAGHSPEVLGGVRQVACDGERAALVAGRPIRWTGDARADGREAVHGAAHLDGILDGLDGRYVVVRAAPGVLELRTDVLGSYPVYSTTATDGTWWAGGLVAPLVLLGRDEGVDAGAVASLLACGWPLDGQPAVRGVRRLPRGALLRVEGHGTRTVAPAPERIQAAGLIGARLDAEAAARDLVASYTALADWPGRPSLIALSGGRDSRVVLAAGVASGLPVDAVTAGGADDPEVVVARAACAAVGLRHRLYNASEQWLGSAPERASALVRLRGGTCSLTDAAGFPVDDVPGAPALWHTGQGGEIARAAYGRVHGPSVVQAAALIAKVSGWRPGRRPPVALRSLAALHASMTAWARRWRARGARSSDLMELAYLDLRMGFWAGPAQGAVEWVRDATSPLWSWKMMPALLAGTPGQRRAESFHRAMVATLAPPLADIPFADGTTWRTELEPHVGSTSAASALPAAARPAVAPPPVSVAPAVSFAEIQALARAGLESSAGALVAPLLDMRRVRRLLYMSADRLTDRERQWIWQLLTATGTGAPEPPGTAPAAPHAATTRAARRDQPSRTAT